VFASPKTPVEIRGPEVFGAISYRHPMAWQGRSITEVCAQREDPQRSGGMDLQTLVQHMPEDSLVGWGFHPGKGRDPVPGSEPSLGALIAAWVESGADCP
jgi:hypothetical protein